MRYGEEQQMGKFDELARDAKRSAAAEAFREKDAEAARRRELKGLAKFLTPQWQSLGKEVASALRVARVPRTRGNALLGRKVWETPFGMLRSDGTWLRQANRQHGSASQTALGYYTPTNLLHFLERPHPHWSADAKGNLLLAGRPAAAAAADLLPGYIRTHQ